MKMRYMAVFDVGGTKTDAVLFDTTGKITARKTTAGGVPLDIGTEAARENYHKVLSALTEETGIVPDTVYGSIATVEYFGTDIYDYLSEKLASPHIRLEGDGPCMISGMLGHTDGCSLVCGTGSSLYTRKGDKYWHTGGWGYLFDSCGSGYVLGRLAIQASLRAHDGRAEPTLLSDLIEKQCGEPAWEHYVKLHRGGRPYIASFASTVFEARDAGDPVARRIFNLCASELADTVWSAYRTYGGPFTLVYNGGILFNHREYAEAVRSLSPADITSVFSDTKPIYGCAVEAMYDLGLTCDDDFKKRFLSSYRELSDN